MRASNRLRSKVTSCFLILPVLLLNACQSPQPTITTLAPIPSISILPTPTVFAWPLEIQLDDANHPMKVSIDTLLELTPGTSTLQDMYNSVGYPRKRKEFADSTALLYPSLWVKSPHIDLGHGTSKSFWRDWI